MTVKEHYDKHLASFYSWMQGDFNQNKNNFLDFCQRQNILPTGSRIAIDLGAGNGIQSIALAETGFKVFAIDFSQQLLEELEVNKKDLPIEIVNDDFRKLTKYRHLKAELIICCGDTISHLNSLEEIMKLIKDIYTILPPGGKMILSFRDYSYVLADTSRFIKVRSDENRILTCFLEFYEAKVRVTDLLYEKFNNSWQQKVSSYEKVRITNEKISQLLAENDFHILFNNLIGGMIYIIGQKR